MMMNAEGERDKEVKDDSQASVMSLFSGTMAQFSKLEIVWGDASLIRPELDVLHWRCLSK